MECSHGKLCTRLTDGLCGDNTNCFTNLYRLTGCHVGTVTFRTDSHVGTAGKNSTDLHTGDRISVLINTLIHNIRCTARCNHMVCFNNNVSVFVTDCLTGETSGNTFFQTFDFLLTFHKCLNDHSRNLTVCSCTTVRLTNDHMLGYINQTSGQVSGIGRTKCGIGQTFTCSMR